MTFCYRKAVTGGGYHANGISGQAETQRCRAGRGGRRGPRSLLPGIRSLEHGARGPVDPASQQSATVDLDLRWAARFVPYPGGVCMTGGDRGRTETEVHCLQELCITGPRLCDADRLGRGSMRATGRLVGEAGSSLTVVRFLEARWVAAAGLDEIGVNHAGRRRSPRGRGGHRRQYRAADHLAHRFHHGVVPGLPMQPLEHAAEYGRRGPEVAVRRADIVDREDDPSAAVLPRTPDDRLVSSG